MTDERFHALIAEAAENQFLLAAYHSMEGQIQRFRFLAGLGVTDVDQAVREHTLILAAFESGDPEGAREAMFVHMQSVRQRSTKDVVRDLSMSSSSDLRKVPDSSNRF